MLPWRRGQGLFPGSDGLLAPAQTTQDHPPAGRATPGPWDRVASLPGRLSPAPRRRHHPAPPPIATALALPGPLAPALPGPVPGRPGRGDLLFRLLPGETALAVLLELGAGRVPGVLFRRDAGGKGGIQSMSAWVALRSCA